MSPSYAQFCDSSRAASSSSRSFSHVHASTSAPSLVTANPKWSRHAASSTRLTSAQPLPHRTSCRTAVAPPLRAVSDASLATPPPPPTATKQQQQQQYKQHMQQHEAQAQEQELEIPSRQIRRPPSLLGSETSSASASTAAALDSSLHVHMVQWYPGHIAKAERQLKEQLKMVDVVLEVRDARIIRSTSHPQIPDWLGSKPSLLVINRSDSIAPADRRLWTAHFQAQGQKVFWTDGKLGAGTIPLRTQLLTASELLNAKRSRRGLQPRPVRSCVIGFPNIGKSALINRLLRRKVVDSAPKPGVTRLLKWVRLGGELDMLDAPGVIPASFNDQIAAQRLAMCNDIGEAAYVDSLVASAFIVRCKTLPNNAALLQRLQDRYKIDPMQGSAEDFVHGVAARLFFGDIENSGARILKDFRNGVLGSFALELPMEAPTGPRGPAPPRVQQLAPVTWSSPQARDAPAGEEEQDR